MAFAVGQNHRILRRHSDGSPSVSARLRVASANCLAVWVAALRRDRSRNLALLDRRSPLAEFGRGGIDDGCGSPAPFSTPLGIVGQQHDIGARQQRQNGVDQFLPIPAEAG